MEPTATQRRQNLSVLDEMRQTSKRFSPLRQTSKLPVDEDEEQKYEERRGEELRRQIQEREAQLAQIASSKDRLKMRIQNSLGLGVSPAQANSLRKDAASPLRQKLQVMPLLGSSQLKKIQIREPESTIKVPASFKINHEASVGSHLYPQSSVSRQTIQTQDRNPSEYQQQLQSDNIQLQRRLNLVVAELDRVTREKLQNQQQLETVEQEANTMQRQIENESRNDLNVRDLQKQIYDQREANHATEKKLQDLDKLRQETLSRLNSKQDQRELAVSTTEALSKGLTEKLQAMKEIEQDSLDKHNQMQYLVTQIKELEWSIQNQTQQMPEIGQLLNRLKKERDELGFKLENLNYTYDRAVTELARERSQVVGKNSRHLKLMASKQMYKALAQLIRTRKQNAINEFYNYSRFDRNCHQALKTFAGVLNNCGSYQLKVAIKRWYTNAMKPNQTRQQRHRLISAQIQRKIKLRMFLRMREMAMTHQKGFGSKIQATTRVWELLVRDCAINLRLAFKQWSNNTKFYLRVKRAFHRLLARQQSRRLSQYFSLFVNYHVTAGHAMREHCLALHFADEQMKLISYGQLAIRASDVKTTRLIKLGHLFKAWRDSNAYRKFLMAANIQAAHLNKQATTRLISQIFHALRVNKESEKHDLMRRSLNSDFQPQIDKLHKTIEQMSGKALATRKLRSLLVFATQTQSKVMSYFSHWKGVNRHTEHAIHNNLKLMLVRLCHNKMRTSFDCWKLGRNEHRQCKVQANICELADKGKQIGAELQTLSAQVQNEQDRQSRSTKVSFSRVVQVCIKRHLQQALHKWHAKCTQMHLQEQAANCILQKWRYSLIRQAFKIYVKQVEALRQEDRCEARLQFQIQLKNQRNKRKIFDAICKYVVHFQRAKCNLGVLCKNLDLWLQRKAYKRWMEGTHRKIIDWVKSLQQQNVEFFDQLNANLSEQVKEHSQQSISGQECQKGLKRLAQKVLSNTFARFYYIKAHRGIKKWIDFCKHQKHLHHILKSIVYRLDKNRMYCVKAAFKNWIAKTIIQEYKAKIKRSLLQSGEAEQMMVNNRAEHQSLVQSRQSDIDESIAIRKLLQSKFKQVLAIITNKVDNNHYQSSMRYMFIQWAQFTKRQTKFVKSVVNLVTKSMWQNGFSNISAFANDKRITRLQNRAGVGMKRMYWKHKMRHSFNQMRSNRYQETAQSTKQVVDLTSNAKEQHGDFIVKSKRWTAVKGIVHINRANLSNLLASWRNVTRWQKTQKDQTEKFNCWIVVQATKFLQKLASQTKLTIKLRSHMKKYQIIRSNLYKNAVFQQMKHRNQVNRRFYNRLNMVANKLDTRLLEYSFSTIRGFKLAKVDCHEQSRAVSAKELCSLLHQMYLLRMTKCFSQLRVEPYTRNDKPLQKILQRFMTRNLRYYFNKFKNQANKAAVVQEVNENGPIVEQAFDQQLQNACLNKFMIDQGFTQLETEKVQKWAKNRSKEYLTRVIARLQHQTLDNDLYLKPYCFDRWRKFCRYRKLMSFHLRNMNNRLQLYKSDLSFAFNRWKYSKKHVLDGIDIRNLISKCANDERRKQQLFELEDSAKQFTEQLTFQRDELVDNYIKSQRMACALARDNKEVLKYKAFSNLQRNAHDRTKYNYELVLSRNINMIQSLKDRIREFEMDNHSLASENEELRQFSLDGYQIAKNVQSLSNEREHLSVDLADKAHTIQKLLDQNAELQRKLKLAQESAVELIQQSHNNMRRMRHY